MLGLVFPGIYGVGVLLPALQIELRLFDQGFRQCAYL
jgi:hypothetical protein